MKRIAALAPALAAISLAMPQPALAETPAEIDGYFKDIQKYSLPAAQDCVNGTMEFEDQCGPAMEDFICSVNAMYVVVGEANLMGRYARLLTALTNILSDNEDYINELVDRGEMRNPGEMGSRMSSYCRSIRSTIMP